jgi:uncharacterized membrane-anchored protein
MFKSKDQKTGISFMNISLPRALRLIFVTSPTLTCALCRISGNTQLWENLLESGTPVLLELAPRDPRSLMQGDYMALSFSVEREIDRARTRHSQHSHTRPQDKGLAVIEPDEKGVYHFVSLYDPAIQLTGKQIQIVYRWNGRSPQIGSGSFLFQEGHGREYEAARYGELRVDEEGNGLIVRLRDQSLEIIDPGKSR